MFIARSRYSASLLGVFAIALGAFFVRFHKFGNVEPRIDMAGYARWVQSLSRSAHFLPDRQHGESWRNSVESDPESFLHHLARGFLGLHGPHHILTSLSLSIYLLWSLVVGDGYNSLVALSIVASSCVILAVGLLPAAIYKGQIREPLQATWDGLVGIAAALFISTALFLHQYAPWGLHNLGVLALVVNIAIASRFLTAPVDLSGSSTRTLFAVTVAATILAIYTHWTNLLILPPAIVLAIAFNTDWPVSIRLGLVSKYCLAVVLAVIPVVATSVLMDSISSDLSLFGLGTDASSITSGIVNRGSSWFATGSGLFSTPGLVLGVFGNVLAFRAKLRLPLLLLLTHYCLWCLSPGVAGYAWMRVYLYVIPVLGLGLSYSVVGAARVALGHSFRLEKVPEFGIVPRIMVTAAVVVLMGLHIWQQVPGILSDDKARVKLPKFWASYMDGQGSLRPMVDDVQASIPESSVLLTWQYGIQDVFYCLRAEDGKTLRVLPALSTMWGRLKDTGDYGDGISFEKLYRQGLSEYLERRNISVESGSKFFLLVSDGPSFTTLQEAVSDVLGPEGLDIATSFAVLPRQTWHTGTSTYGLVSLYEVAIVH